MSVREKKYRSHPEKKGYGRKAAFVCFFLLFILSASMVLMNIIQNHKAEKSYSELRALISQEEFAAVKVDGNPEEKSKMNSNTSKYETPIQEKGMDFSSLTKINPEIIGWLSAEGTNIDYPVAHTSNNEYYLTHLYNGEVNANGTLFVDYRNKANFSDRNTVIYGHHMQSGAMFRSLVEYKDQDFFDVNPTMILQTPDGDYMLELISGTVEDGNYEFVKFNFSNEEEFNDYVDSFRARSTFASKFELQPGDRIVSLCTCSYEWDNARYMVIGRLVPTYE